MIVIVTEKPSVARDIARVLKISGRGDGCIVGKEYTVTWALGHLVTLKEPQELDEKYQKWRMEDLPILPQQIPTKVISKTRSQFSVVKKLMLDDGTDSLICATDAGREGELIFRLIYAQAKCKKPFQRLWISSMTDAAIKEGFERLKPGSHYDGLFHSALARAKADWLVGMNASRAFTLRYHAVLSVGRVQTPTLAILVKRAKEIRAFVPEKYHTLTCDLGDFSAQWFNPDIREEKLQTRILEEEDAKRLKAGLNKKTAVVQAVTQEEKRELPPYLYDLTLLQREANKQLGFTAAKTLKIAQSLYETHKAITYPRTDSKYLPADMAPRMGKTLKALPKDYWPLLQNVQTADGALPVSDRMFNNDKVTDHHAIIPTLQTANLDRMDKDEKALFDMVAKRLIAAYYPPYEYFVTKATLLSEGEWLKASGKTVKALGFKAVYREEEEEEDKSLPLMKENDAFSIRAVKLKKDETKPPQPHTEATLLSNMEHAGREIEDEAIKESMKGSGLGTPATRAAIIERLIQVEYAERRGKSIVATEKGERLLAVVPPEIASPEMTGKWEKALQDIADGGQDPVRFMEGIYRLTGFLVEQAKQQTTGVEFADDRPKKGKPTNGIGVKCPLCDGEITENDKAFGCANWRQGCPFTVWKDGFARNGGPNITKTLIKKVMKEGTVQGSTGVVRLENEQLQYIKTGDSRPALIYSFRRYKKPQTGNTGLNPPKE